MKKNLETNIVINASAEKIWRILIDFKNYPEWNPFVRSPAGQPEKDQQLKVNIQGMKLTPVVLVADKEKEYRWLGKLFLPGLFDGEHYFKLNEHADGTTTFIHGENFSGLLTGLFAKTLETKTKAGFQDMNLALKKRAESTTA